MITFEKNRASGVMISFVLLASSSWSYAAKRGDNSEINQRDASSDEVTSDQQKSNKSDSEITRQIRRALVSDKDLSTYAHNVKIITVDGRVTLKGPVRSQDEESRILSCAQKVAGVSNVTDEMAITPKK